MNDGWAIGPNPVPPLPLGLLHKHTKNCIWTSSCDEERGEGQAQEAPQICSFSISGMRGNSNDISKTEKWAHIVGMYINNGLLCLNGSPHREIGDDKFRLLSLR